MYYLKLIKIPLFFRYNRKLTAFFSVIMEKLGVLLSVMLADKL